MRNTFTHEQNGPFVQGVPTLQGWYWFLMSPGCPVGPEPCKVLLGVGENVRKAVVVWGWGDRNEGLALDDRYAMNAYYAPMSPPEEP